MMQPEASVRQRPSCNKVQGHVTTASGAIPHHEDKRPGNVSPHLVGNGNGNGRNVKPKRVRKIRRDEGSNGRILYVAIVVTFLVGLLLLSLTGRIQNEHRPNSSQSHHGHEKHHFGLSSERTRRRELRGRDLENEFELENVKESIKGDFSQHDEKLGQETQIADEDPKGDFTYIPLDKLNISQITWRDSGKVVTKHALEVRIPDSVTNTLLEYCERTGITQKFRELAAPGGAMEVATDGFHDFGSEEYPMKWYIQRPEEHWNSNMHWISPADEASHEDYLKALGEGGFDSVLNTIGEHLNLEGLVCFQLTFIGVSECGDGYMHHDFQGTNGGGYNVIIPLIVVPDSPPELYIEDDEVTGDDDATKNDEKELVGSYQYRVGAAAVIGDSARHSTARVNYLAQGKFRMAATVYIADVNKDNVKGVIKDYTQHYPPRDENLLLSQAGKHWRPRKMLPRNPHGLKIVKPGKVETS